MDGQTKNEVSAWLDWSAIQVARELYFLVQTSINTGAETGDEIRLKAALAREYLYVHDDWFREQFPRGGSKHGSH